MTPPRPSPTGRRPAPTPSGASGLLAYAVAVFHRASLGVAAHPGPGALRRRRLGALAVPRPAAGRLRRPADARSGWRWTGSAPAGWSWPARSPWPPGSSCSPLATDVPTAIAARVLVGAGDAMTFISVLRVVVAVVPRPHGPAGHPADRHPRPARLDRGRLPAGRAAARHLVGGRPSSAPRRSACSSPCWCSPRCATPRPAPRRAGAAGLAEVRRTAGGHLARARHPDRVVHPPGHPVLRHRLRAAVGLPVPHRRARGCRPATAAALLSLLVVVGMGVGPLLGRLCGTGRCAARSSSSASSPPPRAIWTVVLLLPGPRAAVAAGRARRRAGHQRSGLDDRLRLRPHREPGRAHGQRQRRGQRRRVRRLAAHRPGDRRGARPAHARPVVDRLLASDAFRAAFAVQYLFWAVGLVGVLRHRRQLRARLARDGVVLAPLHAGRRRPAAGRLGLPLTPGPVPSPASRATERRATVP